MAMVREIENEASYIYHLQEYKEHSLILNVMTLNYGPVTIMARGVQQVKSPLKAMLQLYTPLKLTMKASRGDLYYLQDCEQVGEPYQFQAPLLFCASYMNELLYYLYKHKDADQELFATYVAALDTLKKKRHIEIALRAFELKLLESLGYALSMQDWEGRLLRPRQLYRFSFGGGFVAVDTRSNPVNLASKSAKIVRSVAYDDGDDGLLFSKSKVRGPRFGDRPGQDLVAQFEGWSSDSLQELHEYVKNFVGPVMSGETIAKILRQDFDKESLLQAKQLVNALFTVLLNGREIKSRQLYRDYLQLHKGTKAKVAAKAEEAAQAEEQDRSAKGASAVENSSEVHSSQEEA